MILQWLIEGLLLVGGAYGLYLLVRRLWASAAVEDKMLERQEVEELAEAIVRFEAEHPDLAGKESILQEFMKGNKSGERKDVP